MKYNEVSARALFFEESEELLENVYSLLRFYDEKENKDQTLEDLLCLFHTLKGSSAVFGYNDLKTKFHDIENFIKSYQKNQALSQSQFMFDLFLLLKEANEILEKVKNQKEDHKSKEGKEDSAFIRLKYSQFKKILDYTHEMNEIKVSFADLVQKIEPVLVDPLIKKEVTNHMHEWGRVLLDFQQAMWQLGLLSFSSMVPKYNKICLDMALELNKKVELQWSGQELLVDKTVLDALHEPLLHLIRNAIDHGLEFSGERLQQGKPEKGRLFLGIALQEERILLTIKDDGRGIDTAALKQKALAMGLFTQEKLDSLAPQQVLDLVFIHGLSVKKEVTHVSGQGVGMNAVLSFVKKNGGTLDVESTLHQGTTWFLSLPLNLNMIDVLFCQVNEVNCAIPQKYIKEVIGFSRDSLSIVDDCLQVHWRDVSLPVIDLYGAFVSAAAIEGLYMSSYILILEKEEGCFLGLLVSQLREVQKVALKKLGPFVNVNLFSGACFREDGVLSLVIHPQAIGR